MGRAYGLHGWVATAAMASALLFLLATPAAAATTAAAEGPPLAQPQPPVARWNVSIGPAWRGANPVVAVAGSATSSFAAIVAVAVDAASNRSFLVALDHRNGTRLWSSPKLASAVCQPVVSVTGRTVYVLEAACAAGACRLFAVSSETGALKWSATAPATAAMPASAATLSAPPPALAPANGGINGDATDAVAAVYTCDGGRPCLVATAAASGVALWTAALCASPQHEACNATGVVVANNTFFVAAVGLLSGTARLLGYNATTGATVLTYELPFGGDPAIDARNIATDATSYVFISAVGPGYGLCAIGVASDTTAPSATTTASALWCATDEASAIVGGLVVNPFNNTVTVNAPPSVSAFAMDTGNVLWRFRPADPATVDSGVGVAPHGKWAVAFAQPPSPSVAVDFFVLPSEKWRAPLPACEVPWGPAQMLMRAWIVFATRDACGRRAASSMHVVVYQSSPDSGIIPPE